MSRSERLMELLQSLRRRIYAVTARSLAEELGVSVRTVYRDIETLNSQGASVDGEAGVGFLLRPGYTIPPLMFTPEEIEALVLGARWVIGRADGHLARAARDGIAKINAVLPKPLQDELESCTLLVPSQPRAPVEAGLMKALREAIRGNRKMTIDYRDSKGNMTRRTIWPFALAYWNNAQVIAAWCETRIDFRHFRADRVESWIASGDEYPRRRFDLLQEWREKLGILPPRLEL
jgi:predicted DNA-binding transcriptional regulator YafY